MLSKNLCELWNWRGENGVAKDISARDLLRDLDAKGVITLPAPLKKSRSGGGGDKIINCEHDTTPISCPLSELMPLRVEVVAKKEEVMVFKSYVNNYHYLKFDRNIGENIKYAISSQDGRPLASLMFCASAWACRARDEYIGWDSEQRQAALKFTANNSRYLIYPWIQCANLASHTLALVCRRLSSDWEAKYSHPLYLAETFVEQGRFRGTCYAASNWIHVGETTGRGRGSKTSLATLPIKDIWLYPLARDARKKLCAKQ
jgi:hypothetical protein